MKTVEQILEEASKSIAQIHHCPTMFVGGSSRLGDANTLDAVMWMAHWFWVVVQSREKEFRDVVSQVRESYECSCQGFPDAFRYHNPDAEESDVFEHVLKCWADVDECLKIDISKAAATSSTS